MASAYQVRMFITQVELAHTNPKGQMKLRESAVVVIGAGGLGCPALQYLAAAGVGHRRLCHAFQT